MIQRIRGVSAAANRFPASQKIKVASEESWRNLCCMRNVNGADIELFIFSDRIWFLLIFGWFCISVREKIGHNACREFDSAFGCGSINHFFPVASISVGIFTSSTCTTWQQTLIELSEFQMHATDVDLAISLKSRHYHWHTYNIWA